MTQSELSFPLLLAGTLVRWRTAVAVAAGVVGFAALLMIILPPAYRAEASFVSTTSSVQLPRALSGLVEGMGGVGAGELMSQIGLGSAREPSESPAFYYQLLQSRELLTRLALSLFPDPRSDRGDSVALVRLLTRGESDSARALETAVKMLRRRLQLGLDVRTNLVTLKINARWPALSAQVLNRAMDLVSEFNKEQRSSRAHALREFLATRVEAALQELRAVEDSQRLFYERNRSWENSPGLIVEERRVRRQVETANSLYLSLRQQLEQARIDEINTTPLITVVDRAVPPRRRQWPRPVLILPTAALLGGVLGLLAAAARELMSQWARRNPDEAAVLRTAWRPIRGGTLRRAGDRS